MPKGTVRHPMNLTPPTRVVGGIVATDPLHASESWEVLLEGRADRGTASRIEELAQEYATLYLPTDLWPEVARVNLSEKRLAELEESRVELFTRDSEPVVVTWSLCIMIATLAVMEQVEQGDTAWGFQEWALLSATAPSAFEAIINKADEVQAKAHNRLGNSTASAPPQSANSGN